MNKLLTGLSSCVALLGILFNTTSNGQTISTIAGNGISAYAGDGGSALTASMNYPTRTAMDGSGNLYFGDHMNFCIRKINSSGIISTVTGTGVYGFTGDGGPATMAENSGPAGICLDAAGNLYFSDYHNARIRKISTTGIITTIAGNGTGGFSGDGGPATAASINVPWGVVMDATGNIFFCDRYNERIRKINTSGIISTVAGTGLAGFTGDGGPATNARINSPVDITLDNSGNIIFSDCDNHRIRKISTTGIITTVAGNGTGGFGGDGSTATVAALFNPIGVGVDNSDNIYIGDYGNNRVRMVNTSGIISTITGSTGGFSGDGGAATAAQIRGPYGVAVYSGDLYICDAMNYRMRKVVGVSSGNATPVFTKGATQTLTLCTSSPATIIDTLLRVLDGDAGQTLTWSIVTSPTNGTAVVSYSASSGGIITPAALTYTPAIGYTGSDMFSVRVSDGTASDTITINVLVGAFTNAGVISGIDSVCPGKSVTLSETVTGGIWSCSSGIITSVTSSGVVAGLVPGKDTIIYTVINSCGIASAIFPFKVRSYIACRTGLSTTGQNENGITVMPNPGTGTFYVSFQSDLTEDVQFIVTNIIGQKVSVFTGRSNQNNELKLDGPGGIYFLSGTTANSSYQTKIILTK